MSITCATIHVLTTAKSGSGTLHRLLGQQKASKALDLPIEFVAITPDKPDMQFPGITYVTLPSTTSSLRKSAFEVAIVRDIMRRHDAVSTRSMLLSHHYYRNLKRRPAKLVTEVHNKLFKESRINYSKKLYLYTRLLARPCMSINDGVIGVTPEVLQDALSMSFRRSLASTTISNGIDVESIPCTGYKPYDGHCLDIVLLGSGMRPWFGLDRFLTGLQTRRDSAPVRLHLVGDFLESTSELPVDANCEIILHGRLTGKALDDLMSQMNLALATLAFFRTGLKEACTLKVREYMARGIPFILGTPDVDIPSNSPFLLKVPHDETPVDIAAVFDYARKLTERPSTNISSEMRDFALRHLDWKPKMLAYHRFMQEVAER